jgi:EpsI family protein
MAILAVLWIVGSRFRDAELEPVQSAPGGMAPPVRHLTLVIVAGATALSIAAGPAFAYWHENRLIVTNAKAFQEPFKLGGWTDVHTATGWHPIYRGTDREIVSSFAPQDAISPPVDVAFEYYGRNREGHSLITTLNQLWDPAIWHQVESHAVKARLGDKDVELREAVIASSGEKRIVWSLYWMDGRFTTSPVTIKFLQLKTALTGDEACALVALSTRVDGPVDAARARLEEALASFSDLPQRLVEAGHAEEAPKFSN